MQLPLESDRAAKPRCIKFLSTRQKFYQGFTLIELTVVLFLIGLMLFTAMPKVGNFLFQTDLKTVARSLKGTVHFLRSKSIIAHRDTVLYLDLEKGIYGGSYVTKEEDSDNSLAISPLVPSKRLPEGIRFLDASNINTPKKRSGILSSIFNPKGVLEETVIHLTDKNSKIMTIIINAYTGRFLLYDEYVDVEYQ